jgi:hypothetical protein
VQQLAAGLAEPKEPLRRGNLKAALAAVKGQPGLAAALGSAAAPLAKLVAEGCAKAVARADGVAALLLAAHVAAADSAAGEDAGRGACGQEEGGGCAPGWRCGRWCAADRMLAPQVAVAGLLLNMVSTMSVSGD